MNELSNYLVETFLLQEAVTQKVVVYGGRFQPFHSGHYKTYKHLCSVFGAKNVYIATSNTQDSNKSPLSFNEKRDIAVKVFGIPPSKFIQVRSPYQPVEILRDYDDTNTALIVAVGEKDEERLGGRYFLPYKNDKELQGYSTQGYVYSKTPSNSFGATDVRNMFRSKLPQGEKEKQFQKYFGKYDSSVFNMLNKELNEEKEYIAGGLSQGLSLAQIAQHHKMDMSEFMKEFKKGVNVEMEHTTDARVAAEIAKDHIYEDPKYYEKLVTIEGDIDYEPTPINYQPDDLDWDNIMNMQIADPATGKKYTIKQALQLDRVEFARQEAMRVLRVHANMNKRQVPGNIEKGQQSPKSDKVNQVNLALYNSYGEGVIKEVSAKGSGYSPQVLNQTVKNPETGEDIKVSSALNYDVSHPAYKSAMMLVAKSDGDEKVKQQKVKQAAEKPNDKKGENPVAKAGIVKTAKTAVENPKLVARAIGQRIKDWSKKEKEFFKGAHKPESKERRGFGEWMKDKVSGIVKGVVREAKHLGKEVGEAGGGIKALFSGEKMNDSQTKALKAVGKTVALTVASMVATGGIGVLVGGATQLISSVGVHLAEHMVGEVVLYGIGKAALNAGKEDLTDEKYIEWFVLQLADNIANGEIPAKVWEKALDDYNKDKADGKVSEKDWESSSVNEMAKVDMDKVEKYADAQLAPEDVVLGKETDHFFQRLNDPRNGKEISPAELTGFFKRLAKNKKKFLEFIKQYKEFVVKDKRSGINIPFMVQSNKLIAKTIMRKDDFKSSTPVYTTETIIKEDEEVSMTGAFGEATSIDIIKDLDKVKNDLLKKVDILIAKKKKLYSNMDIETPMSADEKKLGKDIADLFSQINTLVLQKRSLKEGLLKEGGAYGHMNHPFDTDINLTFKDLKNIVNKALDGNLGVVREKTDGQALAISWKNGRLIAARNKGHLSNGGANALDAGGMAAKFAGRGSLTDAYNFAMKDLESAIRGLSQAQKDKIFMNGKAFMNLEVIYPTSVNVIPYGQALLVFHNAVEYNEAGNAVGQIKGAESTLAGMIKQINANVQSKYTIQGPPITTLPKNENLSSLKPKYLAQISKLQSEFLLGDSDGVADYHQAWWKNFIQKSGKDLTPLEIEGLTKRWAFGNKAFAIKSIGNEKSNVWADGIEKQSKDKISKENIMKFEEIFLGVGSDVLSFMDSVLTVSPDSALQTIHKRLNSTIDKIKAEGTPAQIEKMKLELGRLNSIGGFDKIVPNEGIIFNYKGNVFKLSGAFASLNQLLGIFY